MKLTDVASLEKWEELERSIYEMSGLNASVFNTDGIRITEFRKWCNELCPTIKANDKGQTFICATAHLNIATMAQNAKAPVIEECDAGIMKLLVPIFAGDEFLGAVGGCGYLLDEGEVDSFYINKTTGIEEDKIEKLAECIPVMSREKAEEVVAFVEKGLAKVLK